MPNHEIDARPAPRHDRRQADATIAELRAENARLRQGGTVAVGSKATLYVVLMVALCMLTVIAIVVVTIVRPAADNALLIGTILGVTAPVAVSLLGLSVQEVHKAVNSRLSQLLELTASASRAEGHLAGRGRD